MVSVLKEAISVQYDHAADYITSSRFIFNDMSISIANTAIMLISIGCMYTAYYLLFIAKHPTVAANAKMSQFLRSHCPSLHHRFWPTFWCTDFRAQTVLRAFVMSCPTVPRTKQFLDLDDGGHVALDWSDRDAEKMTLGEFEASPIILILPGITGCDKESYVLHMMTCAAQLGYRSVVFSNRGNGGAYLKTPRMYNACNMDDICQVISHIKKSYPSIPLLAVGLSFGGMIVTHYLAKYPEQSQLAAAMTISVPWNSHKTNDVLEQFVNKHTFNWYNCRNLVSVVKRNASALETVCDLDYVYESRTIHEFDERFTAPQFGFTSCHQYYEANRLDNKLGSIRTPLLALNAADDPFSPGHSIPMAEAAQSQYVAIALTSHGGHMGFMDGLYPRHNNYMFRVFAEYATAIFQHGRSLAEEISSSQSNCD